jgi:hypothetical protein
MLSKAGLLYFHMTDFEAYQVDYKDWTKAVHNHFFKKVARAITGKAKFSLGRGVAHDDFAWAQSRNAKLQGVSAFTFCASQCFHTIAEWATKHTYSGNIAYIFESGDGFEGELLALKIISKAHKIEWTIIDGLDCTFFPKSRITRHTHLRHSQLQTFGCLRHVRNGKLSTAMESGLGLFGIRHAPYKAEALR